MTETKQAGRSGDLLLGLGIGVTGLLSVGFALIGLWLSTAGQKLCTIAPEGPHRTDCLGYTTTGAVLCFAIVLIPVAIGLANRRERTTGRVLGTLGAAALAYVLVILLLLPR